MYGTGKRNTMFIHSLVIHIFTVWEEIGEKILVMCASDREGGEYLFNQRPEMEITKNKNPQARL
jgi:hypothetical protein